jgi:hypothetical protein
MADPGGIIREVPEFDDGLPRTFRIRAGLNIEGVSVVKGGHLMNDEATAMRWAVMLAGMPDVQCVAVVDLYSADDPVVVAWAQDDGGGARVGATPPPRTAGAAEAVRLPLADHRGLTGPS